MKFLFAILTAFTSLTTASAHADLPLLQDEFLDYRYDTPLTHGFIPSVGYDDNDQIEFVAHGYLPNACYQLSGYRINRNAQGQTLNISVLSERLTTGICSQSGTLPADLLATIPFTVVLPIGQLPVGNYQVSYLQFARGNRRPTWTFDVSSAQAHTIDNIRYATVQSLNVAAIQELGSRPRATVSLTLTSSCVRVTGIEVQQNDDDVFVVLPRIEADDSRLCTLELRSEEHIIPLDVMNAPGSYLLHVRSHGGRSENKVFTVQR